jgi:hypothetical protein
VSPGDVPLDQLDPKQRHDLLKWVYKILVAWSLHLLAWKSNISILRNVSSRKFSDGKLPKIPYGMKRPFMAPLGSRGIITSVTFCFHSTGLCWSAQQQSVLWLKV